MGGIKCSYVGIALFERFPGMNRNELLQKYSHLFEMVGHSVTFGETPITIWTIAEALGLDKKNPDMICKSSPYKTAAKGYCKSLLPQVKELARDKSLCDPDIEEIVQNLELKNMRALGKMLSKCKRDGDPKGILLKEKTFRYELFKKQRVSIDKFFDWTKEEGPIYQGGLIGRLCCWKQSSGRFYKDEKSFNKLIFGNDNESYSGYVTAFQLLEALNWRINDFNTLMMFEQKREKIQEILTPEKNKKIEEAVLYEHETRYKIKQEQNPLGLGY